MTRTITITKKQFDILENVFFEYLDQNDQDENARDLFIEITNQLMD